MSQITCPSSYLTRLHQERIMAAPSISSKAFKETNKRVSELKERLEHMIIYQAAEVMGDKSNERPKDYFCNPGGRLGIDKVCVFSSLWLSYDLTGQIRCAYLRLSRTRSASSCISTSRTQRTFASLDIPSSIGKAIPRTP